MAKCTGETISITSGNKSGQILKKFAKSNFGNENLISHKNGKKRVDAYL